MNENHAEKKQKRNGEAIITNEFQVKLESEIKWERWGIDLLRHLKMIVGSNGISLSCVIRQNSVPDHSNQLTWDGNQDYWRHTLAKNTSWMH